MGLRRSIIVSEFKEIKEQMHTKDGLGLYGGLPIVGGMS